ncbi:MAG: helix-turn-helix domain-containing protein [Gemmatimonadota bacterium]
MSGSVEDGVDGPRPTCDPTCGLVVRRCTGEVDIGYYRLEPGYALGAHAHIRHGLVLVCQGALRMHLGGARIEASPDRALVLPAATEHIERPVEGPVRCLLIEIPATSAFDGAVSVFLDGPRTVAEVEPRLADRLAARMTDESAIGTSALAADAYESLLSVQGERDENSLGERSPPWLGRVVDRLRARGAPPPALAELAGEAEVTPEHLARTFRRCTGLTVGSYLRCLRLLDAARALRESDLPLATVASSTGFSDQSHMTREVRAHLGVTPGEYRTSWRS